VGSPPALPPVRSLPTGRVPPGLLLTFRVSAPTWARFSPSRLSWDSFTGCPAADTLSYVHSWNCRSSSLGPLTPISRSRSALVVSHHLNGLLRTRARTSCDALPAGVRDVSRNAAHKRRANLPHDSVSAPHHALTPRRIPLVSSRATSLQPAPFLSLPCEYTRSELQMHPSCTPSRSPSNALTFPTCVGPAVTLDRHLAALAFTASSKWVNHFPPAPRTPARASSVQTVSNPSHKCERPNEHTRQPTPRSCSADESVM